MGRGPNDKRAFEFFLIEKGVSAKDIGWILSKLDSQEYVLDDCHYMARISNKESESKAKESFINRYFVLNVRDVNSENNPDKMEAKQGNLIPVLVQAIKELSAKNDALAAEVASLKTQINN